MGTASPISLSNPVSLSLAKLGEAMSTEKFSSFWPPCRVGIFWFCSSVFPESFSSVYDFLLLIIIKLLDDSL